MKKFNSPCLYCGVVSRDSVCRQCKIAIEAKDPKRRERNKQYDYEWQKFKIGKNPTALVLKMRNKKDLTADHILSLANGGSNILENIMILCRKCNSSKK
jgi:5-methylcytosine-specific restriction endonuclease McrA